MHFDTCNLSGRAHFMLTKYNIYCCAIVVQIEQTVTLFIPSLILIHLVFLYNFAEHSFQDHNRTFLIIFGHILSVSLASISLIRISMQIVRQFLAVCVSVRRTPVSSNTLIELLLFARRRVFQAIHMIQQVIYSKIVELQSSSVTLRLLSILLQIV